MKGPFDLFDVFGVVLLIALLRAMIDKTRGNR